MDDFGTLETGFNAEFGSEANTATTDYDALTNKPSINGVELSGDKSTEDLGIEIPAKVSELENDAGYQTQEDVLPQYTKTEKSPNTFKTDVVAPIVNMILEKSAVQSGSGTVSPTNVRPYQQFESIDIVINGKTYTRTFEKPVFAFRWYPKTGRYAENVNVFAGIVGVELGTNTKGVSYIKTANLYPYSTYGMLESTSMYRTTTSSINNINDGYIKYDKNAGCLYVFDNRFSDLDTANGILKELQLLFNTTRYQYFATNLEPIEENTIVGNNVISSSSEGKIGITYCRKPYILPAITNDDTGKFVKVYPGGGSYVLTNHAPITITVSNAGDTPTITIPSPYTESNIVTEMLNALLEGVDVSCAIQLKGQSSAYGQIRATSAFWMPMGIVFSGICIKSNTGGMTIDSVVNVTVKVYMAQWTTLKVEVTETEI